MLYTIFMPEAQGNEEQQETPEVGQWFKPLERYDKQPYSEPDSDGIRNKELSVLVNPLGTFLFSVSRNYDNWLPSTALLLSPHVQEEFQPTGEGIREMEKKYETPLIHIVVYGPEEQLGKPFPYVLQGKLEDDPHIYTTPFTQDQEDILDDSEFQRTEDGKKALLFFPEGQITNTNLLMRIAKRDE